MSVAERLGLKERRTREGPRWLVGRHMGKICLGEILTDLDRHWARQGRVEGCTQRSSGLRCALVLCHVLLQTAIAGFCLLTENVR